MLFSRLISVVGAKLRTSIGIGIAVGGIGIAVGGIGISNYTSHRAPSFKTDYFEFSESDLQSDDALWGLYKRWCRHYRMERWRSREEMERRFEYFKDRAIRVHEVKSMNMNMGYTLSLVKTADCSVEERMGYIFPDQYDPEQHAKNWDSVTRNTRHSRLMQNSPADADVYAYACCNEIDERR